MNTREETISAKTMKTPTEAGVGCLLQIHPLDICGNLVQLVQNETTVGREARCGLHIPDSSVSRSHAIIARTGDEYRVTDLGSTNGTCVNEQRIESAILEPGDRIQFGSFIFKFLSTNHIELQYHEAVYSMMTRDGLTGTLNKRSFLEILHREFCRAAHRSTPLSLILFDIDHFKSVNDTWGHMAGDEVLQEMGRRVQSVLAEHDVFARYGGEEFAILLPDVVVSEATEIAERCRHHVEATPFTTSAGPLEVTISAGAADMSGVTDLQTESQLIQLADQQLYAAKRGGRNRVCC